MDKVKELSDAVMAKGPGKQPRKVFNILKVKTNINKGDIVVLEDGLYICSSITSSSCSKLCRVTLTSWDPKDAKGKILVNKKGLI